MRMTKCPGGRSPLIVIVAALVAVATASAVQQAPPDPIVRENATVKISDHVHVIPDNSVGGVPNVGIIAGTKGMLIIDTGLGSRNGQTVRREAAKLGTPAELYVVTTHVHPEHDLGASAFPASAKMIRSRDQIRDIDEFGLQTAKTFASRTPLMAQLLEGASFRRADITFDKEHRLDLGGVRVRIMGVGGTHTRGDTAIFVEDDDVLFAGDVVMPSFPAFASPYARVSAWLDALDRLEALKPARIVPSHGPMGDLSMLRTWREYFRTLQARARELKAQGRTADQAAETLQAELQTKYPKWNPAQANRVGPAARAAFAEAP
jgi:glyoxylase-like metal-dependent hydrolase (beta-lactamase superfamily II)